MSGTATGRSEAALINATRRLIRTQEDERLRIASELHDDIGQRLALLQIGVDQWIRDVPDDRMHEQLDSFSKQIASICADVRRLSHGLYMPAVRLLAVGRALSRCCEDVQARTGIRVDFSSDNLPDDALSSEFRMCLFRVLQEALLNAVKHSGTDRIRVALTRTPDAIHLTIEDFGIGFQIDADPGDNAGLGLVSMCERVAMLGGTFTLTSTPSVGTTIHAAVPFAPL